VTQATSTTASLEMDTPAEIRAIFDTSVNGTVVTGQKSQWITLMNSKLTVGKKLVDAGSALTTVPATGLFPFLDGYQIYAGQCTANNPATSPNTGTLGTWSPTPGQILTMGAANDIRLPSINVRVVSSQTGSPPTAINGATVKVYTADSGCANTFTSQLTNSSGAILLPGYPYGKYTVCAQSGGRRGFADVNPYTTSTSVNETVNNFAPGGNTTTYANTGAIRIYVGTTSPTGTCP
jgi:hypothetical protein